MKQAISIALVLIACLAAAAVADIPLLLNYQGVLTDGSGVAVPDNTYSVTFKLYNVPGGGSELWTETDNIVVSKGTFSVTLGTLSGLNSLPFNETYYLGMSVDGGPELPRQILTTSPYAFTAKSALGTANVFPSSGAVGIGSLSPGAPLHVQHDNTNFSSPAIIIDNGSAAAGQNMIDFRFGGTSTARIRQAQGGDFFLSTLANNNICFMTNSMVRGAVTNMGDFGVGTLEPAERMEVVGGLKIGYTSGTNAGTLRWTGGDFEGYDGSTWRSFTDTGTGTVPSGSAGQTLRHDGVSWIATSNLYNDGTNIGIGTDSPAAAVHVQGADNEDVRVETTSNTLRSTLELKTADGIYDYLRLAKFGSGYSASIDGISLADMGLIHTGTLGGPMMIDVMTANPLYFLTSNLERMRLTSDGNLGINTKAPEAKLHIDGNQWDLTNTEGDFKIGSHDYRLKFGVATGGGGAGTAGIRVVGGAEKLILGGGASEVLSLDATGNVGIGSSSASGELNLYRTGVANEVMRAYTSDTGGNITMNDEAGNGFMYLEPDADGTGGYFSLSRNTASQGFFVNGNYLGSGNTYVGINGASRSAVFNMNVSGNASILLPTDAISAPEIKDEPGAASYTEGVDAIGLEILPTILASRTIVTPDSGYVLVIATAQTQADHTTGINSTANYGLSDDPAAFPVNQDVAVLLVAGLPTGTYCLPTTVHGLFKVASAGSYTYYFLGSILSGSASCVDFQLTLLYIPTSYGTVQPTLAKGQGDSADNKIGPAMTLADVSAQRVQSEAINAERIQKELAAMRAELDALKLAVENR